MENFIPNEEYESEFFNFLPSSKIDDVIDILDTRMDTALESVVKNLSKMEGKGTTQRELDEGFRRLQSTTDRTSAKMFQKVKAYALSHVFRVPDNVCLREADAGLTAVTQEEIDAVEKEIEEKRSEILAQRYLQAALKRETREVERLLRLQTQGAGRLPEDSTEEICEVLKGANDCLEEAKESDLAEQLEASLLQLERWESGGERSRVGLESCLLR